MKLEGKIINFLGDSITQGVGVSDPEQNRYDRRLFRADHLKAANNYGIGGTRFAYQRKSSENPSFDLCMCGRAYYMDPSADIILVYGGVNDYLHGDAPIGKKGDRTPETFYGAVEFLMTFLKENYRGQIAFAAPAKCYYDVFYTERSPRKEKQPDAGPLKLYVDIIAETAKEHGIPLLNLYEDLPYDPLNHPEQKARLTREGLHFNDLGHELLAETFHQFLSEI